MTPLTPSVGADPRAYRPGDEIVQIWPSDDWVNISADARVMADSASRAFREALERAHLKDHPNVG